MKCPALWISALGLSFALGFALTPSAVAQPDQGRADPPDLRGGHVRVHVGGGVWFPSEANVGGSGRLGVGVGLNRYLELQLAGGFGHASLPDLDREGKTTSIDIGLDLAFHPTQAFALDPWIRYGFGYRHTLLSLPLDDETMPAFDFAKLAVGADFYPVPEFGIGPFLQTNLGLHAFDDPHVYANVVLGLRFTFDPMQADTRISP